MGRRIFTIEWLIFIPAVILVSLGLVTLLSVEISAFYQQLVYACCGLLLFWFFAHIDFSLYQYLDTFIYVGCVAFLLLSFLGPSVRGSTRWLELAGFRLQPSELIKPFFLVSMASLLVRFPPTKLRYILYHMGFFILPATLIFIQPDLGSALVYTSMWTTLIILAGLPLSLIFLGGLAVGIVVPLGYHLLRDYQKLRIATFVNPFLDPRGAGYNAIQSMIAVGSGELFGRGFGRGTQSILKFLPERHTDFIFATFSEEFGFIGGCILILIFLILLWHIVKLAQKKLSEPRAYLYAGGLFAMLFTHVVINVGMNLGLVPITGITLPLVSYGGSSLLTMWIGLGMLVSAMQKSNRID